MKYQIIYADPPWRYRQGKSMGTNFQGAADAHYETMDYLDICKLPIADLADTDCLLFMWVTFPMLVEGLEVIKAWGFEYKTVAFTWVKVNLVDNKPFFGVGYYTKSNAEVCLLGTKGHAHRLVKSNSVSQMIVEPKTVHSRKPAIARNKIVELVGDISRIELFARNDGRQTPIDNAFQRGETKRRNSHPTVKSQSLMQYLIKLITPPKGIVLDMFAGSCSTLLAAKTLGYPFIGIEISEEYCKIGRARLAQGTLDI